MHSATLIYILNRRVGKWLSDRVSKWTRGEFIQGCVNEWTDSHGRIDQGTECIDAKCVSMRVQSWQLANEQEVSSFKGEWMSGLTVTDEQTKGQNVWMQNVWVWECNHDN